MSDDGWEEVTDPRIIKQIAGVTGVKNMMGGAKAAASTPQDRIELNAASARAQAERDAQRTYASTEGAISDFGTGPYKAGWIDSITPAPDDSLIGGTLARVLGWIPRAVVADKTLTARDRINTVRASATISGANTMKGAPSDKDTALQRLAGIDTYKSVAENKQIIRDAKRDSEVEQLRAQLKAKWIGKYGSLSAPSGNGSSFEEILQGAERNLLRDHWSGRKAAPRSAPPSTRKSANAGWSIQKVK